jgi:hypothetical protein
MNLDVNLIISLIPKYIYVEDDGTTDDSLIKFIEVDVCQAYERTKSVRLSSAEYSKLNEIVRQYYKPEECTEKRFITDKYWFKQDRYNADFIGWRLLSEWRSACKSEHKKK